MVLTKRLVVICAIMMAFTSCKKSVLKTHPELIGFWRTPNWCMTDYNYSGSRIQIHDDGTGNYVEYSFQSYDLPDYSGKVKTNDNDLYVDRNFVFTIVEVKDTSGYIYNPNSWMSLCDPDSIFISAILRVKRDDGKDGFYFQY